MQCEIEPERSATYRYRYAGCRCDAWREQNRERVEARNRRRCEVYEPVTDTVRTWTCRSCGKGITSSGWRRWTCDECKRAAERAREARNRARRTQSGS
jgi:hypothetical protein